MQANWYACMVVILPTLVVSFENSAEKQIKTRGLTARGWKIRWYCCSMLLCSFSLSVCSFFPSFPQVCLSLHPSIFSLACLSLLLSKPASLCSPYLHFLYSLTPFLSFPPICVLLSLSHYFLSYTPSTFSFPLINHCLSIHFLKLSAQSVSLPSCPTFSPNPFLRLFPLSFHILFLFYTTPSSSPSLLYTSPSFPPSICPCLYLPHPSLPILLFLLISFDSLSSLSPSYFINPFF